MTRIAALAATLTTVALVSTGAGLGGSTAEPVGHAVTSSLAKAWAAGAFRYRLRATFRAELDEARLDRVPDELGPDVVQLWARGPLTLTLEGASRQGALSARGALRVGGSVRRIDLRNIGNRMYLRLDGRWRWGPGLWQWLESEMFGGLIPLELCVPGDPYGCRGVDLAPALASGRLGRLLAGRVAAGPRIRGEPTWRVIGRLSARELAGLKYGGYASAVEVATYRPYERSSSASMFVGRRTGFPLRLVLAYRLDRSALRRHLRGEADNTAVVARSGRLVLDFWGWGQKPAVARPQGAIRIDQERLGALLLDVFRVLYLHY